MTRSGLIVADQPHYFKMLVFRGDLDHYVEVSQGANRDGRWNAPAIYQLAIPAQLSAIDADCWATALLAAARRARRMARYTGRPSE